MLGQGAYSHATRVRDGRRTCEERVRATDGGRRHRWQVRETTCGMPMRETMGKAGTTDDSWCGHWLLAANRGGMRPNHRTTRRYRPRTGLELPIPQSSAIQPSHCGEITGGIWMPGKPHCRERARKTTTPVRRLALIEALLACIFYNLAWLIYNYWLTRNCSDLHKVVN